MPIFKRKNGVSIYYELINDARNSEDVIVLLGGLTRDHTIWRKMIPLLRPQYKLILIDNRDAGQSSVLDTEYEISDMADDISDLLLTLNFKSHHIVGHSMGGFMAIHIATKNPELVKTLTLCSTVEKQIASAIEYLKFRIKTIENRCNELQMKNIINSYRTQRGKLKCLTQR